MSSPNTAFLILALGFANIFLWWFVDRILWERLDAVASGVVRGVPMSKEYRRIALSFYAMYVGGAIGGHVGLGVFWFVAAQRIAAPEVRVIAYIATWIVAAAVAAWIATGIVWHRHFASVLRQTEAD